MATRLLDTAKTATQLAAWLDLKDNISDDGSSVVSEDSEDDYCQLEMMIMRLTRI